MQELQSLEVVLYRTLEKTSELSHHITLKLCFSEGHAPVFHLDSFGVEQKGVGTQCVKAVKKMHFQFSYILKNSE